MRPPTTDKFILNALPYIFNGNLVIVVTLIHMYIYMYAKMVVVRFTNELYSIDINLIAVKEPRYAYCSLAVEAAA